MNLVSLAMTRALAAALDRIEADRAIRAVVVAGAGDRAFCTGSDVKEFAQFRAPGAVLEKKLEFQNAVFNRLDRLGVPTVAAAQGLVIGGGLEIALCCDFLLVETRSRLAFPEIRLGVFPSSGGPIRASRRIGSGRARKLILRGDVIDAATALDWGLVDEVVPDGEVCKRGVQLARDLATRAPMAYGLARSAIDLAFDQAFDDALAGALVMSDLAFSGPEAAEGSRAFLAKEAPEFRAPASSEFRLDQR